MAFVSDGGKLVGMVTVTDILEVILGTKIKREEYPESTDGKASKRAPRPARSSEE
jgi:CBS domain containing-hemolysin-like protein